MKKALALFAITVTLALGQLPKPGSGSGSGGSGSGIVATGEGIVVVAGVIAVDSAVVPVFSTGAGVPSAVCTTGREFYTDTTNDLLYFCVDTNTWAQVGVSNAVTAAAVLADTKLVVGSGGARGVAVSGLSGVVKSTSGVPSAAASSDIVGLFASGACSGYLKSDGTCDTPSGGADPIANPDFLDDFDAGNTASGTVGRMNWTVGGGATSRITAESGVPGIVRRATGTTNGTNALTYNPSAIGAGILPAESFDITMRVRLNQTDANTNFRAGLQCDTSLLSNVPPNNGIYFEKLETDTNWFGVTRASSSSTRTNTSQAASTSWVKLRIRRVNGTTIGFTVNSTPEVTATATIPTAACVYWMVITNSTTADKTFDVDYFRNQISGLTR